MGIALQGNGGTIAEVDGSNYRALRVNLRPLDAGTLGHFRVATTVMLLASQAANGTLYSFRWTDSTRLCAINTITLEAQQTSAQTGTIYPQFEVFAARSFTAGDSGGTAITLTGNSMKRRTSSGTTLVTDIRKSTAAAGLTVGTRTLDADPQFQLTSAQAITTANQTNVIKSLDMTEPHHPLILAQNEGFIVRGPSIAFGVAGTANLIVGVEWAELAAY